MKHLVQDKDYLFNLAGQSSHMDSMRDPYTDLEINCHSPIIDSRGVQAAQSRSANRIRQHATDLTGRPDYTPVDEAHSLKAT